MKQLAIATVLIALTGLAVRVQAGDLEGCCACLDLTINQTGQNALFCVSPQGGQFNSSATDCNELGGSFTCYKTIGNASCRTQLADAGITCPTSPAPAASGLNLLTLAVSLAGLGGLLLHRRRQNR